MKIAFVERKAYRYGGKSQTSADDEMPRFTVNVFLVDKYVSYQRTLVFRINFGIT